MKYVAALLAFFAVGTARAAEPQTKPRALEVDLFAGASWRLYPGLDSGGVTSSTNVGAAFAGSLALRSRYFIHPFVDVAFLPIQSAIRDVDLSPLGTAVGDTSRRAWGVTAGPGFDVWRVRLRAGIGFYNLSVHSSVRDSNSKTSDFNLGYSLAAAAFVWRGRGFQLGLEGRYAPITTANMGVFAFGVSGSWDAHTW